MKLKHLSTAMILATLPATGVFAAALDRSGQSMSAFLQPGNYFEAGISVLDPDVSGKEAGSSATRRDISDMGEDYFFPNAALKLQLKVVDLNFQKLISKKEVKPINSQPIIIVKKLFPITKNIIDKINQFINKTNSSPLFKG